MFDLYNEFRQLVAALDEQEIDYALCGGLAMAVYDRIHESKLPGKMERFPLFRAQAS